MLSLCGHADGIMPATALYNKKWLLRLFLDRFASSPHPAHPLSPASGARWFSDALLAARFVGDGRGDKRAEGYTRADGAIGHFRLGSGGHGDLSLNAKATQFVVIAAKLEGALSSGAKNASYFDQAARTVACMAHLLEKSKLRPEALDTLSYHVVAPAKRISQGIFDKQLDKSSIRDKVLQRAKVFGAAHRIWIAGWFEPALERMSISAMSWEDLVGNLRTADKASGSVLKKFYDQCLAYNPPR